MAIDRGTETANAKYQVLARKWRPQSFSDLVGQDHISTTLKNAIHGDRLPQALLFTGVRGTGKTSTARILAKTLRCTNLQDETPCGVCRDCEDIASSRAVDVIEIDGASNNGVDAIRELREGVGYMPSSGKFKIYIIDEVHMLSTAAFNALLKTLEEPPSHVIFVLATTEVQKIPNTILSRCQRFDFRRISSRLISDQLLKICKAEDIKAAPDAVWAIARQADGSMRDGQSLLDQVITFSNKNIELDKVIDVLGLTDRKLVVEATTAMIQRNTKLALEIVENIQRSGVDPKLFAQDLLEEIRNTLMVRVYTGDPTRVVDLSDSEITALKSLSEMTTEEDLHALFDMLLKGVSDLLRSPEPHLVLEMTLLKIVSSPSMMALSQIFSQLAKPTAGNPTVEKAAMAKPAPPKAASSATPAASTPATTYGPINAEYSADSFSKSVKPGTPKIFGRRQGNIESGDLSENIPENTAENTPKETGPEANSAANTTEQESPPPSGDPWQDFVYRVRKSNGLLGAMLENTHIIEESGSHLTLGVPKRVGFVLDKLRDPENVKRIEQFVETFWEKHLKVDVKLAKSQGLALTPKAKADQAKEARKHSVESAVEQNPLVRQAKNIFKTQVKAIRDIEKPSK